MTLPELQAKRDKAFSDMVASQQVTSGQNSVTKRPTEQYIKAIAALDAEIARLSSTSTTRIGRIYTGEGL